MLTQVTTHTFQPAKVQERKQHKDREIMILLKVKDERAGRRQQRAVACRLHVSEMLHWQQTGRTNCTLWMWSLPTGQFGRVAGMRISACLLHAEADALANLHASAEPEDTNTTRDTTAALLDETDLSMEAVAAAEVSHVQKSL